jgi:antitoxin component YwqK of YwqJK toxin-antitoxin module
MKILQMLVLLSFLSTQAVQAQGFFFFGNSNLVGTGKMVGKSKEGVWKVYGRKELLNDPSSAVASVAEEEVRQLFNLAVPQYQLEFKENLLDGVFEEFYPDGRTKKVVNYQNGMLHGDFFEFSKEGEVLLSGSYFQGEKSGDWFVYRSDGSIKSEYSYQNNALDGLSTAYYPSGQVAERIPFKMGEINGVYESFYPDGRPKQRVAFVDGQEQGEFTQFFADGKLAVLANFSQGVLEGIWEDYDDQGRLLSKGRYQQGDRVGEWKEIYPALPEFYQKGNYTSGIKNGTWQVVGKEDFIHQEEAFKDGILMEISAFTSISGEILDAGSLVNGDGRRVMYDAEGNRLEKGRYVNGMRTGTWFTYFPQTSLVASSGTYVAGKKRGTWKQYDFNGQLVSEQVFEGGPSQEPEQSLNPQTTTAKNRSRLYRPNQTQNGIVRPQIFVLNPDGGIGVSGPGMFPLGN